MIRLTVSYKRCFLFNSLLWILKSPFYHESHCEGVTFSQVKRCQGREKLPPHVVNPFRQDPHQTHKKPHSRSLEDSVEHPKGPRNVEQEGPSRLSAWEAWDCHGNPCVPTLHYLHPIDIKAAILPPISFTFGPPPPLPSLSPRTTPFTKWSCSPWTPSDDFKTSSWWWLRQFLVSVRLAHFSSKCVGKHLAHVSWSTADTVLKLLSLVGIVNYDI